MEIPIFDKTIGLLGRALDLRTGRHQTITANIANQDTPGYKATEIRFQEALNAASGAAGIPLETTHRAHISPDGPSSAASPVPVPTSGGSPRLDGNTVNGEREMAKLAENTLMYNATVQMIAQKFRTLKDAIRGGN